jgi:hypothetical protein
VSDQILATHLREFIEHRERDIAKEQTIADRYESTNINRHYVQGRVDGMKSIVTALKHLLEDVAPR